MRLDDLTIALRPRSPWEATDLGIALVRAHAARIYAAWVLVTLPVFALLNLAIGLFDPAALWLAALPMWWLKPAFDRIVVHVVSRAVFGEVPGLRETVRAQLRWGWRATLPWLLWRRFHPGRAMLLPVDLLEGVRGARRSERASVLGRGGGSPNVMLTFIGANLEAMLVGSIVMLALMFVPVEFLSQSAKAIWQNLFAAPPWWGLLLLNGCAWIATAIVEPFYVGAGFGLYLNRRTQLEAWDVELAFRRIARRLSVAAAGALVAVAIACAPRAHASDETASPPAGAPALRQSLPELFGDAHAGDGAAFEAAVRQAYADGDLRPRQRVSVWKPRTPRSQAAQDGEAPAWAKLLGAVVAFLFQYGLWILIAVLLVVVAVNHRRWLPWLAAVRRSRPVLDPLGVSAPATAPETLPADIPAAVRALLAQGRSRPAFALLYRAGVQRLAERLGTPLPPGSTEADCLRQARRLGDAGYAALFVRIAHGWQAVAYAQRDASTSEIEILLDDWSTAEVAP